MLNHREVDPNVEPMRVAACSKLPHTFASGRDVYQFGVWCGRSLAIIEKLWQAAGIDDYILFGFDSFEGLPDVPAGEAHDPAWKRGAFSATADLDLSVHDAIEAILDSYDFRNATLIPGFWDKVLNDNLIWHHSFRPASYIDIDCDIYSSAVLALDYMFRNGLVTSGTLIGYHDWLSGTGAGGEQQANQEILAKYGARAQMIWCNGPNALWKLG